jgi:PII-like signaling protein
MNEETLLRIYVGEGARLHGARVFEWLLANARELGIEGGCAMRAMAGYGRHGWHEDTFFELAGDLPVEVSFVADASRLDALLARVSDAGLKLFYFRVAVRAGHTGP